MSSSKNNEDLLAAKARIQEVAKLNTLEDKQKLKADILQLNIIRYFQTFMEERGWKKKDIAHHLGVSKSHITQIFSGDKRINLNTIIQICDLFEAVPDIKIWSKQEAKKAFKPNTNDWIVKKFGKLTAHISDDYLNEHKEHSFKEHLFREMPNYSKIMAGQLDEAQNETKETSRLKVG